MKDERNKAHTSHIFRAFQSYIAIYKSQSIFKIGARRKRSTFTTDFEILKKRSPPLDQNPSLWGGFDEEVCVAHCA